MRLVSKNNFPFLLLYDQIINSSLSELRTQLVGIYLHKHNADVGALYASFGTFQYEQWLIVISRVFYDIVRTLSVLN